MPTAKFFADNKFTQEQQHTREFAFNNALRQLNLVDRNDPVCEIVARKVIEVGKDDSSDPESLPNE